MQSRLLTNIWERLLYIRMDRKANIINLMKGVVSRDYAISHKSNEAITYTIELDPSVKGVVKKLKRWAVYKGLTFTSLVTSGLLITNSL